MSDAPHIADRAEQPYAAISGLVTMAGIGPLAQRTGEVFGWLAARGIAPAGPPFLRYNVIDMERELDIEAGVPIAAPAEGDEHVKVDTLPAGRYVVMNHIGSPDTLIGAVDRLLSWADSQDLTWDSADTPVGDRWGCRLEILLTDPDEQPDMTKWETQLAFRLAD
jgi:effector-binding domain-containing protein